MITKINADSQIRGTLSGQTISTTASASSYCDSLFVEEGNPITILTGQTLTIDVPFSAGLYQVFNCVGTGAVEFASGMVKEICPDWWATNDPKVTNMTAAVQAAVTCALGPTQDSPKGPSLPIRVSSMYKLVTTVNIDTGTNRDQYSPLTFNGEIGGGFYTEAAIDMFSTTLVNANPTMTASDLISWNGCVFEVSDYSLLTHVVNPKLFRLTFTQCSFLDIKCLDTGPSASPTSAVTYTQSNRFVGCWMRGWVGPWYRAPSNFDLHFLDCSIEGTDSTAPAVNIDHFIDVVDLQSASIIGCVFESVGGSVIRTNGFLGVQISGNYFEANNLIIDVDPSNLGTGAGCAGVVFSGNYSSVSNSTYPCIWKGLVNLICTGNRGDVNLHSVPAGSAESANIMFKDNVGSGAVVTPALIQNFGLSTNLAFSGALTTLTDIAIGATKTFTILPSATDGIIELAFSFSESTTPKFAYTKMIIGGFMATSSSYYGVTELAHVNASSIVVSVAAAGATGVTFTVANTTGVALKVKCLYSGTTSITSIVQT